MKRLIRNITLEIIALYFVALNTSGLVFQDPTTGILITGVALGIAMILIRPVVNLLILPLSLATLGLFRFIGHAITLYLVDRAVQEFQITHFSFSGFHSVYFDLPALSYEGVMAYIAFSIVLAVITHTLHWLTK